MSLDIHEHREPPEARLAISEATLDVTREIASLRAEPNWQQAHNAKTLVKRDDLRVVLLALNPGGRLERHQAPGPITIHALDGRLRIEVDQRQVELGPGQLLALDAGIPHEVVALEESAFLLTIAWPQDHS